MNAGFKNIKLLHPVLKSSVQEVFEIDGQKYYEFVNLLDMPAERYLQLSEFVNETDMKINRESLSELLKEQEKYFNEGQIAKAMVINEDIQRRMELFFEVETMYRLASAVFFTFDEDLYSYDYDYNDHKIKLFKKNKKAVDFFLNTPIRKFLPQTDISPKDFEVLLKMSHVENERLRTTLTTSKKEK